LVIAGLMALESTLLSAHPERSDRSTAAYLAHTEGQLSFLGECSPERRVVGGASVMTGRRASWAVPSSCGLAGM